MHVALGPPSLQTLLLTQHLVKSIEECSHLYFSNLMLILLESSVY